LLISYLTDAGKSRRSGRAFGVQEDHIVFANLLASPRGLDAVCAARPRIRIVTSSIEERMNEHSFMAPSIGGFGDRFFGTVHAGGPPMKSVTVVRNSLLTVIAPADGVARIW
jgi:hypothetical protein